MLVDHRLFEGFVAEVEAHDGLMVFAGYGGNLVVGEALAGFGEGDGEVGIVFGIVFVDVDADFGSVAVCAFREVFEGVFVLTVELVPYCHCKFVVDRLHDGVLLLDSGEDVLADFVFEGVGEAFGCHSYSPFEGLVVSASFPFELLFFTVHFKLRFQLFYLVA